MLADIRRRTTTWIFQGNPNTFDIDSYLRDGNGDVVWLVKQHAREISVGDTVFLWRSEGNRQLPGGVIAELRVIEPVSVQTDDPASLRYWREPVPEASSEAPRVRMRLLRLASKREVLKREWLTDDAVLKTLLIVRQPAGTNFPVESTQERRLRDLWENTGRDWSRDEDVAALYAYGELFGKPISRSEHSLVSRIAQQIGRATTGVYNKLMNFRSLDPRAQQEGLKGASEMDRATWREFYDESSRQFDSEALADEYRRLWGEQSAPPTEEALREAQEEEARRLEKKGLEALLETYRLRSSREPRPLRRQAGAAVFARDPLVIAITKLRAQHRCEVEGCVNHTFSGADDDLYVEVHHLQRLADGGKDRTENTAALCANHHREIHFGKKKAEITDQLRRKRLAVQSYTDSCERLSTRKPHDHLVQIDEQRRELRIYRLDANSVKSLFTSAPLPSGEGSLTDFAMQLGENLLMDSPAARRLLKL
jgi:hypothetical protein